VFDEPTKSSSPISAKSPPPIFFMEHLFQALHGVDAPDGSSGPPEKADDSLQARNLVYPRA
jgi:hypothetical protein